MRMRPLFPNLVPEPFKVFDHFPGGGGGHSGKKSMLTCVYGRFSNEPISLKFMIEESHPFLSPSLQDAPLRPPRQVLISFTDISRYMADISYQRLWYEWQLHHTRHFPEN